MFGVINIHCIFDIVGVGELFILNNNWKEVKYLESKHKHYNEFRKGMQYHYSWYFPPLRNIHLLFRKGFNQKSSLTNLKKER